MERCAPAALLVFSAPSRTDMPPVYGKQGEGGEVESS